MSGIPDEATVNVYAEQQMTYHKKIEIDPSVSDRQPVVKGTRIPVAAIVNETGPWRCWLNRERTRLPHEYRRP